MKSSKLFWGVFFLLAAVYVIVSQFGILPEVGVFAILLTVFLIGVLIEGIKYVNFYQIFFSIAILYLLHDERLGIAVLSGWTVLGAALFASIGCSILFDGCKKKKRMEQLKDVGFGGCGSSSEQCSGEILRCENNFGSAIRYVNSDNFKSAKIENNFGSLSVYFDNAVVQMGSAVIDVENCFGETNLYIPKEWKIQNNIDRSFGSVSMEGQNLATSATTIFLNGSVSFGAMTIHFI